MTTATTTRPAPKAPAPRGRKKTHTKPAVPLAAKQAEKVTMQMYQSLKAPDAPKASPQGYIMGAAMVLKLLIDQAVAQGENRDALKAQAMTFVAAI